MSTVVYSTPWARNAVSMAAAIAAPGRAVHGHRAWRHVTRPCDDVPRVAGEQAHLDGLDDGQRAAVLAPPGPGVRPGRGGREDPHHHPPHRAPGRPRARRIRVRCWRSRSPSAPPSCRPAAHPGRRGADGHRVGRGPGADVPRRRAAASCGTSGRGDRRQLGTARQQVRGRSWRPRPGPDQTSTDDVRDLAGEIEWAKASPRAVRAGGREIDA